MSMEWIRGVHCRHVERRRNSDRRSRHVLFSDWRWSYEGRRQRGRRDGGRVETGVDIYERRLFFVAVGIFVLSCMDAAFTLLLVHRNLAAEANPFMRALLSYDPQTFINLKIVLTGSGVLFLVALCESRFLRLIPVRYLMHGLLVLYGLIVASEVVQLGLLR